MENNDRHYRIVGLPGDCIGPEVYASAAQVLEVLAGAQGFSYELDEQLIGGAAVDATGEPLPQATQVRVEIYNLLGQPVRTLFDRVAGPGAYEVPWDGRGTPSGLYFYRLETPEFTETKKMVLLR